MSYRAKATYKSTITGDFTSGSDKWTGAEVQAGFTDMADSVEWTDQFYTMTGSTFDAANGSNQACALTGNITLAISNAVAGRTYVLIKTGAYTITLPTGHYSASGSTVPTGRYILSFIYDGTNYHFNYASYSAT